MRGVQTLLTKIKANTLQVVLEIITEEVEPSRVEEATNKMEVTDLYVRFVVKLDILLLFVITCLIKAMWEHFQTQATKISINTQFICLQLITLHIRPGL